MVEILLDHGADVSLWAEGWTPLHNAVLFGKTEIVKVLLANGADVNSKTNEGKTPSDLARINGHTAIVQL